MILVGNRINRNICKFEKMAKEDLDSYFWTGKSAIEAIKVIQNTLGRTNFSNILDMASGHGRVLRWLKFTFPKSKLSVCEVQESARIFCKETFGADAFTPPELALRSFDSGFDLIWVGSLFTHLDIKQWDEIFDLLHGKLAKKGVLVFTTHGELVASRIKLFDSYGLDSESQHEILKEYSESGFGYKNYPVETETNIYNSNYGVSISSPYFVLKYMERFKDMRLIFLGEMKWANHQDVYAFIHTDLSPATPESMNNWMSS